MDNVLSASAYSDASALTETQQVTAPHRYVLRTRVDGTSYAAATALTIQWAQRGESRCIFEVPVNGIMEAFDHEDFCAVLNAGDLVTPGGMPIVWMLRALGLRGQPRVYGPELTLRVCEAAARLKIPVGFYGGAPSTLGRLKENLLRRYPGLLITYAVSPPFRPLSSDEEAQVAHVIKDSGCRILFVGLGCPKQERWMTRQRGRVPAVMLGVGAAFDFISGQKRQAYPWMQAVGLEWLFRWATEPRRLFFRYAYHNPRFVLLAARQVLFAKQGQARPAPIPPRTASPGQRKERFEEAILERDLRSKGTQLFLKRIFDIAVSLVALTVLAPLFLLLVLLVKFSSPGPVLFRQSRIGFRGKTFLMLKFRSMRVGARPESAASGSASCQGTLLKGVGDPRVTRLGKFLRSTSLDELPQLFNVLKGDMSLVGPRPLLAFMLAGHDEFARTRALVRPGITGLWQVSERENNTSATAMMSYDLEYIHTLTLWSDARILLRTLFIVVSGNGAF